MGGDVKSDEDTVRLYVKSGVDGERMGACPFCHRVYMVVMIKAQHQLLSYELIVSNPSKPPDELKRLGLKHLPALIHEDEGFDTEDDIVTYLDDRFPGGGLNYDNPEADNACKDFFSKFCFYIKAVNQDSSKLDHALEKLNAFLESSTPPSSPLICSPTPKSPISSVPASPLIQAKSSVVTSLSSTPTSGSPTPSPTPSATTPVHSPTPPATILATTCTNWPVVTGGHKLSVSTGSISNDSGAGSLNDEIHENLWLCGGPILSHLDCEVLPKLQQLRVAAAALKQYQVPTHLRGVWRYLHNAYTHPVFSETCPCDQEIVLHWHDRPETKKLSHKKHAEIAKEKPRFSFDVPVRASVVTVLEMD